MEIYVIEQSVTNAAGEKVGSHKMTFENESEAVNRYITEVAEFIRISDSHESWEENGMERGLLTWWFEFERLGWTIQLDLYAIKRKRAIRKN